MNRPTSKARKKSPDSAPDAQPELPLAAPSRVAAKPALTRRPGSLAEGEIKPGPLDERFAELMVRLNGGADSSLRDAAATVSAWRGSGHVCIPLQSLPGGAERGLAAKLLATKVVGAPGEWKPLVLDAAGRLYLYRYWRYEQDLAAGIHARVSAVPPVLNREALVQGLDALFGPGPDDQRSAAEKALTGNFTVITGGPGTGKTRTVARILALLHAQFAAAGRTPQLALAAPTGKAATRMTDSIRQAIEDLSARSAGIMPLEIEAVTLHRLLGINPQSPAPRYHAGNPLAIDAVIVDEASMVDLALMAKLFAAVPLTARLILLGDQDQLASVEAGHVLGDICNRDPASHSGPLAQRIAGLRQSFRFAPGSGIDRFSRCVNSGDADGALTLLTEQPSGIASMALPSPDQLAPVLRAKVVEGYRAALTAADPRQALIALNQFRILCAVRRGPYGVENLNVIAQQALTEAGLIVPRDGAFHGKPVMILRNDYALRLFNGDVGLILHDPESENALRAFFLGADGSLRRIVPSRLPEHESVWAMTVHKSQGSEFERILLILPDQNPGLLTRELIYTAITRSRQGSELWFRESVLRNAILTQTERQSGLHDALWGAGAGG